jgi:hypothetical protein
LDTETPDVLLQKAGLGWKRQFSRASLELPKYWLR